MPKVNRYAAFCNTLRNEDGNLSGAIVTDSNGDIERWGINQKSHPSVDVSNLLFEDAMKLYGQYWSIGLDNLTSQILASLIFDLNFNMGDNMGVKFLQQAIGVADDGVIGSTTLQALENSVELEVARKIVDLASQKYEQIGGPNLAGWLARLQSDLNSYAY